MIYEFALDPALVATWYDRFEYLYFEEKFGVQTRRIVSTYPKDWKRFVWEHAKGLSIGDMAKKKLETILSDVLDETITRSSTFPEISDWMERAEKEHESRPFRAIIASGNPRGSSFVIESGTLVEKGHDLWNIPDLDSIERTPESIALALQPVLQYCKKVVFVEPYFSVLPGTQWVASVLLISG